MGCNSKSPNASASHQNNKLVQQVNRLDHLLGKCLSRLEESEQNVKTLQKMNGELQASLEFVYNKVDDLQRVSLTNDDKLRRLRSIEDDCNVTRNRVDVLDNKSRKKNIRIINIKESEGENHEQLRFKVDNIIKQTGNQCCSVAAFRAGNTRPSVRGKPRPIIAMLTSEQDRNNVLRSAYKLKSMHEGIYIQDDVCQNTVLERQKQMDEFRKLKTQYQTVYFRGHKLKYKGRKQPQQHQRQLNMQGNADFPRLNQPQQPKPQKMQHHQQKKTQHQQQGENIHIDFASTRSESSHPQTNGNNGSVQQQAEVMEHQPQRSAVAIGGASSINCPVNPTGSSDQLTGKAYGSSSGVNAVNGRHKLRDACHSDSVAAPPPRQCDSDSEKPRRSPRISLRTHAYKEQEL